MSGKWVTKKIGALGRVVTGKTPSTSDLANFNGLYPFIVIPDLAGRVVIDHTRRTLSQKGADIMKSCLLPPGAVVMSCIATVGKCGVTARPSFTNQQINSVIPNDDTDSLFLYYVFTQLGRELESAGGGGSVYTNVSKSRFSDIEVSLPDDISEQRAIARILGALDDKIELNRRMNQTLEEMARAIFKSWFVDFDPVRAKMEGRASTGMDTETAALFPDGFEESELGMVPRGWEVGCVSDMGEIICGKTPPTKDPENYGSEVPFVTIPDMHNKVYATKTGKCLSTKGAELQHKKYLSPNSICVSCIATPGLVVLTSERSQTNQQINSVVPKEDLCPYYCFWALRALAEDIRLSGSGGSVFGNLSKGRFSELQVLLPPTVIIRCFHKTVESLFDKILLNECQSRTLAALRDALLPKLISGEIQVGGAEGVAAPSA